MQSFVDNQANNVNIGKPERNRESVFPKLSLLFGMYKNDFKIQSWHFEEEKTVPWSVVTLFTLWVT